MVSQLTVQPRMLLAAALVSILDFDGRSTKSRVLLDSASQANFVSESCVRMLNLTPKEYSTPVVGINGMSSNLVRERCPICEKVPPVPAVIQKWKYLENMCLAQPLAAHDDMDVDLLLEVEEFGEILCSGYVRGQNGGPHAINIVFGWVLMGKLGGGSANSVLNYLTSVGELDCTLKKFWKIESIPKCAALSKEDQQAEELLSSSFGRMDSRRYVVKLPFPEFPSVLGDSYSQALRRFKLLGERFRRGPALHEAYCDFMADYLEQGHMSEVGNQVGSDSEYYIPHDAVVKRSVNEIHTFCYSSEKSYAVVVYLRQVSMEDNISVNLVCAKTRVAPLKRLSIPRLELCAALLAAELINCVSQTTVAELCSQSGSYNPEKGRSRKGGYLRKIGNLSENELYEAIVVLVKYVQKVELDNELRKVRQEKRCWILSAKRAIASVLSRCIKCFRVKPPSVVPVMSDLPSVRISEVKPFSHSGVDLFGALRMSLGIWESGVKSVKTQLRRVIDIQALTYEELSTVLIHIEAMLNSRPLCSLSSDPNDVGSLTPGHFITLEPLNAPPDEDLLCVKSSRLNKWQLVQQMQQHF
nr:unnamed protein product [Callosobruchus analis]